MGVGAIKVDFGEAAPLNGVYANGRSGFYEHNLYPLRYNKAVADITRQVTGENIIWARSAWAGSQRYPLHWGGDAENPDTGMAATLRGGLSFGLCGFTFWSHDIGGFAARTARGTVPPLDAVRHSDLPQPLPRRAAPGAVGLRRGVPGRVPPLRRMKYRLMPYIYAQAKDCQRARPAHAARPVLRISRTTPALARRRRVPVRLRYSGGAADGSGATGRDVYLPAGQWIDYQTGKLYAGGWHKIEAGPIPVVMLVRDGA